ncbi:hypothetical protein VZH09_10635 [Synechococcus elongatus IITB7]|uniref:hypothetical protein n=1 Tax=Synechococcus elongatus TaxID=32046 RepID=UPI0030CF2B92
MDVFQSEYHQPQSSSSDKCPLSSEVLTNTLAELAEIRGLSLISQALRTHGVGVELEDYDNWDGGIWTWLVTVSLPPRNWAQFASKEERHAVEEELTELASVLVTSHAHRFIVRLAARAISDSQGLTNQGRAHSSNPAAIEYEGLFFRSQPEIWLFAALRETGLPVMPLPVVTSNKFHFGRIEPDFVVIRRGMTFVIEVDGDRWHQETPAKAQERLRHLEDEGVRVIRVSAEKCNSPASAKDTAKDVLMRIERFLESR